MLGVNDEFTSKSPRGIEAGVSPPPFMIEESTKPPGSSARLSLPALMLVAANLVPLVGVLAWGWQVFEVVVLYWFENVVIGAINVLKMLVCSPDTSSLDLKERLRKRIEERGGSAIPSQREAAERMLDQSEGKLGALHHASKLFFIPFFTVHYGLFTTVHGIFVFSMLGGGGGRSIGGGPFAAMPEMLAEVFQSHAVWAVLALAASHLVSFVYHFLVRGEFRRTVVPQLMFAPYGRVVVLHVAILGGGFAIQALGSPVALLVILVIGKIAIDLGLHFRSHRKLEAA